MTKQDREKATVLYGSPLAQESETSPWTVSDDVAADIVQYVQQALARFGTAGEVDHAAGTLFLKGISGHRSVSILPWARQWDQLSESARRRRAGEAARSLSTKTPSTSQSEVPGRAVFLDPRLLAAVAILTLCALWVYFFDNTPSASTGASTSQTSKGQLADGHDLRDARAARSCRSTMTRVYQGGSVTVADVEGWLVEVVVAKTGATAPLDSHPALRRFVSDPTASGGSKFIWDKEPNLAALDTSDTLVQVVRSTIGTGQNRVEAVTLSFGGTLVDAYFKEEGRASYYHIANTLSDVLNGTHSALYARCFDQPQHALGAWFRGSDAGGAAASLVYFMGTYAEPLHLARPYSHLPGDTALNRAHAFKSITQKTSHLTREDLATLLGKEGGMATGKAGHDVVITFPFADGNRASRASRGFARVTSLGF